MIYDKVDWSFEGVIKNMIYDPNSRLYTSTLIIHFNLNRLYLQCITDIPTYCMLLSGFWTPSHYYANIE